MTLRTRNQWVRILSTAALFAMIACKSSSSSSAAAATPPSISGSILHRSGYSTQPISGAQVCVEATTKCTTSASDGGYVLDRIAPGPVFVSASATGYLPGETRRAVVLAAGEVRTGVDIILSGRPTDSATYVGSTMCRSCHGDAWNDWHGSAHFQALDRTTRHVDVTGWPAAPSTCGAPATVDSGITGADPTVAAPGVPDREIYLVRWGAGCGAGKPEFAMAFDTNQDGAVDTGDAIVPVTASAGGVATGDGQCGNGGILPASAPCSANLGGAGSTDAVGWWQQEYLTDIGGAAKPAWVTWDTSRTPADALVMPLAWNQRTQQWVAAPDFNFAQDGTWSKACAGCHEEGLSLAADASGLVTQYASVSGLLGCEKCHGPGSEHLVRSGGDPRFIVNPRYLTAEAATEVCAQCHSQGVASASPAGAFGFAWNDKAAAGGGNFIPGVHQLSDFMTAPSFGDADFYWPAGFPAVDHLTAIDLAASPHATNAHEKVTCSDCHAGHAGAGGPARFSRADEQTGDEFLFQGNDAALRDDVVCLACHAGNGSFAGLALSDTAAYHVSAGGNVQRNGVAWLVSAADRAAAVKVVATTVRAHMLAKSACTANFDPTGSAGAPTGRCGTCHMAKTTFTGSFFSGLDTAGKTANVIGDVSSHTFAVATPDQSQATLAGASSWDGVMPNGCSACHAADRFGL